VLLDRCYLVVAQWLDELSEDHQIIIVSGRHETCNEDTVKWLELYSIPFDFLFMRRKDDNRSDTVVKQEILNIILDHIPKEHIKFVLDDRPKVIRMWKENGLTVYPVRGAVEEF